MRGKSILIFMLLAITAIPAFSQEYVRTADLFERKGNNAGDLNIEQDPGIDTLISRYILMSRKVYENNDHYGMNGYRIQIYNSSTRNAREESRRTKVDFVSKFPSIDSEILYSEPGYFKVRVGNFRTRAQAAQLLKAISRDYPNAYIVPDIINFPELERN